MKLYHFPPSPNTIKVLAALHHCKTTFSEEIVDLTKGESMRPDYLELNPNGMIPLLEDGELKLWESHAIMRYVAEVAEAQDLYPIDLKERIEVERWLDWHHCHWGKAISTVIFETLAPSFFEGYQTDHKLVEKSLEDYQRFGRVLEAQLDGKDFVLGKKPRLADFALASPLVHRESAGVDISGFANIKSWYSRIESLPAWQKAMPPVPAGR